MLSDMPLMEFGIRSTKHEINGKPIFACVTQQSPLLEKKSGGERGNILFIPYSLSCSLEIENLSHAQN